MQRMLGTVAVLLLGVAIARAQVTGNDPLPGRVLTCAGSVITMIGPRLEGDPNFSSGNSVVFKNGASQVSYEKVPAIINSKRGDHVLVCLVYIPRNCPPGDNRGRIYTTTNLRTLESWTLPDSEHSCGGA